jgi:hypothetical protein
MRTGISARLSWHACCRTDYPPKDGRAHIGDHDAIFLTSTKQSWK